MLAIAVWAGAIAENYKEGASFTQVCHPADLSTGQYSTHLLFKELRKFC